MSLIYDSLPEQPALCLGPAFLLASCATRLGDVLAALGSRYSVCKLAAPGWRGYIEYDKGATLPQNRTDALVLIFALVFDRNVRACQCGFRNESAPVCMCAHVGLGELLWSCGLLGGVTHTTQMISSSHDS